MPDIPITVVFLFVYLIFAVIHIKIMRYNKDRGHKFVFNGALFGRFGRRSLLVRMVLTGGQDSARFG